MKISALRVITLAGVLALGMPVAAAEGKAYTFSELQGLANKHAWQEVVDHLDDIPAAQRGAEWQALLQKSAEGWLTQSESDDPLYALDVADRLLDRYDSLHQDAAFTKHRAEIGLKAVGQCLENTAFFETCSDRLRVLVEKDPQNLELAFQAGKIARRSMKHWAAVPYFAKAIVKPNDPRCADPDVALAVVSALELPPESYAQEVKQAQALADRCFDALRPALLNALSEGTSYYRGNACPLLKARKALNSLNAKRCS